MSVLLETIKKDQLMARKAGEKEKATLLTTLIGEASPSGNEKTTDETVTKVIEKFVKDNRKNLGYIGKNDITTELKIRREIAILEDYLPKQLTEDDLKHTIRAYIDHHGCDNVGAVMKMLKMEYPNQYDGKLASTLAKGMF